MSRPVRVNPILLMLVLSRSHAHRLKPCRTVRCIHLSSPRIMCCQHPSASASAGAAAAASTDRLHNYAAARAGRAVQKMTYDRRDGVDYMLMLSAFTFAAHLCFSHPALQWLSTVTALLSTFLGVCFVVRHGFTPAWPTFVSQPLSVPALIADRLANLSPLVCARAALALGETVLIRATPEWRWHFAGGMRLTGAVLILVHLACTTAFRMRILWDHLHQQDLVRGALARTSWRLEAESPLLPWLLVHGWVTGLAANLAAVMPWAALLCVREQSLLLLPLALVADVLCTGLLRGVRSVIESINEAFYRNHWLEHHSRLHFVYLHGMHHDALPFGAIAVGEEGVLGELVRRVFAVERNAFMSHLSLFQSSTLETLKAMVWHQYIPGIFPYTRVNVMIENHHIEHHFLRMKPLAFGSKIRLGSKESAFATYRLDEMEASGYEPDNPTWQRFVSLHRAEEGSLEALSRPTGWWEKLAGPANIESDA